MVQIFYYAWKYRLRYFRNNEKSTLPQRYRAFTRVRCTLRLSFYAYMALMGERHVRIEISDFVMRTFVHMHENIACDISGITTKTPCRRDIVHLRVSDAHCV